MVRCEKIYGGNEMRVYLSLLLDALMWPLPLFFDCLWGEIVSMTIFAIYFVIVLFLGYDSPMPLTLAFIVAYGLFTLYVFVDMVERHRKRCVER